MPNGLGIAQTHPGFPLDIVTPTEPVISLCGDLRVALSDLRRISAPD